VGGLARIGSDSHDVLQAGDNGFFFLFLSLVQNITNLRLDLGPRAIITEKKRKEKAKTNKNQDQKEVSETMGSKEKKKGRWGEEKYLLGSVRGQGKVTME